MKYINVFIYLPGSAGKFTQFLTSLHLSTRPHIPLGGLITDISTERLNLYSFKNLYTLHGSWKDHHQKFFSSITDRAYTEFLNSKYTHYNFCEHPHEFYQPPAHHRYSNPYVYKLIQNKICQSDCQIRHLQILVSAKYQSVVDEFKIKNGNFPFVRPNEEIENSQFTRDHDPYIINLDNYFIGESNFLDEYTKIDNYLEIPAQVDLALQLYQGWIEARNSNPYSGAASWN